MIRTNQAVTQPCREIFKALADETRWLIVKELLGRPQTVGELAERLSVSHYNISKHLKVLREISREHRVDDELAQLRAVIQREGLQDVDLGMQQ